MKLKQFSSGVLICYLSFHKKGHSEMDNSEYPKRNEMNKRNWKEGPPTIALALGLLWILFEIIPVRWKSVWVSVLILILTLLISIKFGKLELPLVLKWGISLSVYVIGLVFFITSS
jgi:hypothetical protein